MEQKQFTKFGAYDPLNPNGIVSVSEENTMFGLRFLIGDKEKGTLYGERAFPFGTVQIGEMKLDSFYELTWEISGRPVHLTWCRTGDRSLTGRIETGEGLTVLAELYVPRLNRLDRSWVNFTRQSDKSFAGELISPFTPKQVNALWLETDTAPQECLGYRDRDAQLQDFRDKWRLRNINQPTIWCDMGLSCFLGLRFESGFSFTLETGNAREFLENKAGQNKQYPWEKTKEKIAKQLLRCRQERLDGSGILHEITGAFNSLLTYNTIYKETTGRRYIMVDRPWARSEDGWGIQFNWDTFLSSWSSAWINPELAKENMLSGYDVQLPDGRIPLYTTPYSSLRAEPPITAGRAQHIVQGITLWNTYLHTHDRGWLERCYNGAKRANAWWFRDRGDGQPYRDGVRRGMLGFGYDPENEMGVLGARLQPYVAKAQYAYFETYDDSPQWTTGEYFVSVENLEGLREQDVKDESHYMEDKHVANIYTLERCCLYAADCEAMKNAAIVLERTQDAEEYEQKRQKMIWNINQYMWSEEDGCYYNLKFNGEFSKKQSPDCFLPLITGGVPQDRKEKLIALLKDERKFWGEYMIPSIARDDPSFEQQHYWRGQIWPPMVLWTYLSLKRAGERELAWTFAQKAAGMLAREWSEHGYSPENYNAITGRNSGSPHYNWGVLMGLPLLEELVEYQEDRVIFGNPYAEEGTCLSNIPVDGRYFDMRVENGITKIESEGKIVAEGEGRIEIKRDRAGNEPGFPSPAILN